MFVLIILSAFVAALIGLFIGESAENLMVGVNGLTLIFCNLIPSNATFGGIMSLVSGTEPMITKDILILMAHCLVWFSLYLIISKWKKKKIKYKNHNLNVLLLCAHISIMNLTKGNTRIWERSVMFWQ